MLGEEALGLAGEDRKVREPAEQLDADQGRIGGPGPGGQDTDGGRERESHDVVDRHDDLLITRQRLYCPA